VQSVKGSKTKGVINKGYFKMYVVVIEYSSQQTKATLTL